MRFADKPNVMGLFLLSCSQVALVVFSVLVILLNDKVKRENKSSMQCAHIYSKYRNAYYGQDAP